MFIPHKVLLIIFMGCFVDVVWYDLNVTEGALKGREEEEDGILS